MTNDLIRRNDAKTLLRNRAEELKGVYGDIGGACSGAVKLIDNLPSAQPEIIRCKECMYQVESWNGMRYCEAHGDHIGKDYDYCSNARRKENG